MIRTMTNEYNIDHNDNGKRRRCRGEVLRTYVNVVGAGLHNGPTTNQDAQRSTPTTSTATTSTATTRTRNNEA